MTWLLCRLVLSVQLEPFNCVVECCHRTSCDCTCCSFRSLGVHVIVTCATNSMLEEKLPWSSFLEVDVKSFGTAASLMRSCDRVLARVVPIRVDVRSLEAFVLYLAESEVKSGRFITKGLLWGLVKTSDRYVSLTSEGNSKRRSPKTSWRFETSCYLKTSCSPKTYCGLETSCSPKCHDVV